MNDKNIRTSRSTIIAAMFAALSGCNDGVAPIADEQTGQEQETAKNAWRK